MPPKKKPDINPPVVIPSRHSNATKQDVVNDEGLEETEIAAQLSIPQDGGWAWVVLFASFWSVFILDGCVFTFGTMLQAISHDLGSTPGLIVCVNSIAVAIYFSLSPLSSAFINRFGFRACAMVGSVICSIGLFLSYISKSFATLLIFYGIIYGMGCSLVNMSAGLVVGFHFEKLRAIALAIGSCGTSAGISIIFPVDAKLVTMYGWKSVLLLNSGLHGVIYFLSMAYRPLLSVTITSTDDSIDPQQRTRTVTYLPSVSVANLGSITKMRATNTEKLFRAVSNSNFPTAAAVVGETMPEIAAAATTGTAQAGPSTTQSSAALKFTLTTQGTVSKKQLKQVQSIVSRERARSIDMTVKTTPTKPKSCCGRLFQWAPHTGDSRPMYRDDAFYEGRISELPVYQKSMADVKPEEKTGLEYQLAVSRTVTTNDLHEKKGVFTTAVRRVLATMMDIQILKKCSFLFYCGYGFSFSCGALVPYMYLKDRNSFAGVDETHNAYFVSVIAFSSLFGRLALSAVAIKFDPIKLSAICVFVAGFSTVFSGISTSVVYQYAYSFTYGFSSASISCLRSLTLVKMYGLEKLTNATGMYFLFLGVGSVISTPLAGFLQQLFGYDVSFYVAGSFMISSGLSMVATMFAEKREKAKEKRLLEQDKGKKGTVKHPAKVDRK